MAIISYDGNPQSIYRGTPDADYIEIELRPYDFRADAWGDAGNDVYVVDFNGYSDSADWTIHEDSGGGTDTVIIDGLWSSFSLQLDDNVENLTLRSQESSGSIYGNALNNQLIIDTGNWENDWLNGGAGADTMAGGQGSDGYQVDNVGDKIVEAEDEGEDYVYSSVSYVLPANVEDLYLQGEGANINGTGNAEDNEIYGNGGNNVISGLGGDDYLKGNDGNDNIQGGDGNDSLNGGFDNDVLAGGNGNDDLYGESGNDNLDGGAGNDYADGGEGKDTVSGGAGDDELRGGDYDNESDVLTGGAGNDQFWIYNDDALDSVVEAAGGGDDVVYSGRDYVLPANVESLYLTNEDGYAGTGNASNNFLYGNWGEDTLSGLAGNDVLDGAEGSDLMIGGAGNDSYLVNNGYDEVQEDLAGAAGGTDTVFIVGTEFWWTFPTEYTLGANVENLIFGDGGEGDTITGAGNELNNLIVGNWNGGVLRGFGGNDTLDSSADTGEGYTLYGGAGNDTYIVGNWSHKVVELADQGTDTVIADHTDFELTNNLEKLTVLSDGGEGYDAIGNELDNTIIGGAGNEFIVGGDGNDSMAGGAGNDEYIVQNAGDVVTEAANAGNDTIVSSLNSYSLNTSSPNVEELVLAPGAATGIGNGLNNTIWGNAGNNSLDGGLGNDGLHGGSGNDTLSGGVGNDFLDGGRGNDSMTGGAGNDTYMVSSSGINGDKVVEAAAGGTDTVYSTVSYTLPTEVENLYLEGLARNGTGNAGNNMIFGNDRGNLLTGADGSDSLDGGWGIDTLVGGAGSDVYFLWDSGDVVSGEDSTVTGGGTDTVVTRFNGEGYSLGAGLENLTFDEGYLITDAYGNSVNNLIIGNEYNNYLDGGIGNDSVTSGNDTLIGNEGNDTLYGATGNDSMKGGEDDDQYYVDSATDVVDELGGNGDDAVYSTIAFSLVANGTTVKGEFEFLYLEGTGNINGTGNALDNYIEGNTGNNSIFGGLGNDTLSGGGGNDGNDTLKGDAGNDNLIGYEGADTLEGGIGDDFMSGGLGADSMVGGVGNDIYEVDNSGDVVNETLSGGGVDRINLDGALLTTYTLPTNVENAIVAQNGGLTSFTGNGLANLVTFSGAYAIDLDAGAGNDTVSTEYFPGINSGLAITLDGGDGIDQLGADLSGGGTFSTFTVTGFEMIGIDLGGGTSTWNGGEVTAEGPDYDIAGNGATLNLQGQGIGSSYALVDFYSTILHLSFVNGEGQLGTTEGPADALNVSVADGSYGTLTANDIEFLNIDAATGWGGLDVAGVSGTAPVNGTQINLTGGASFDLTINGDQQVNLSEYFGEQLKLYASAAPQTTTVALDDVSTSLYLSRIGGGYYFDSVTLDMTFSAAPSEVTLLEDDGATIKLVSDGEGDVLRLNLLTTGTTVDGTDFGGELILSNLTGYNLSYFAGLSNDWIRTSSGSDSLYYGYDGINGAELDGDDRIDDEYWGDSDILNADISGLTLDNSPAISGIETINFSADTAAAIDASGIEGFNSINLSGAGSVVLDGLRDSGTNYIDSSSLSGGATVFADGAEGSFYFTGGGGNDLFAVEDWSYDTLNGGLGNDTLAGGDGYDIFMFNTTLGASNVDVVQDFDTAYDDLYLSSTIFTPLSTGWLSASNFLYISGAPSGGGDGNDYLQYDTSSGNLYYVADGVGGSGGTLFATLYLDEPGGTTPATLNVSDIYIA